MYLRLIKHYSALAIQRRVFAELSYWFLIRPYNRTIVGSIPTSATCTLEVQP